MIDRDLIESLDPATRVMVESAIGTLTASGILEQQRRRLFERVLAGSDSEDIASIAEGVKRYRGESLQIVSLIELGETLLKEMK